MIVNKVVFNVLNYQFSIKLHYHKITDFVFFYTIQSSNAAATNLNVLSKNWQ